MIIIEEGYSLKQYNTFGLCVYARIFAEVNQPDELKNVVNIFRDDLRPRMILGGGSNVLFTKDYDGIVIFPDLRGCDLIKETGEHIWIKVFAGENWDDFVGLCVSKNWGGLENLSLIPGKVGASPIQNIGAYGVEVKDVIESVETLETTSGKTRIFTNAECGFGYRDSIFKREAKFQYIITAVTFKLSKQPAYKTTYKDVTDELKNFPEVNLNSIRQAIIQIRQRKLPDPKHLGNAGSFFKNPIITEGHYKALQSEFSNLTSYPSDHNKVKISAAWLIEAAGWKGKRIENVGTCETQPLVIVNHGNATGSEIVNFAKMIQEAVLLKFNIALDMEVNII